MFTSSVLLDFFFGISRGIVELLVGMMRVSTGEGLGVVWGGGMGGRIGSGWVLGSAWLAGSLVSCLFADWFAVCFLGWVDD